MKLLRLLILVFLVISCNQKKDHPYTFYYWKAHLSLDKEERNAMLRATVPYLYTRFFDVDKINGKFQPVGVITKDKTFETDQKIVSIVFITNRTFIHIKKDEIEFLAKSIHILIEKKINEYSLNVNHEIQIDCDWTAGTKDDYFYFLKELHKISGKQITCTLRLHQVKDKKITGIPPVEKVYLMCYSTSSPLENSDKNSILDVNTLKSYLSKLNEYPVKNIEVALPIYSWGIVTNHLKKHKLINGLSKQDLDHPDFRKISENDAEVLKDGFYFGSYLNKGFRIKVEEISDWQLEEVIRYLEQEISQFNIIYYQLDSKFVRDRNL